MMQLDEIKLKQHLARYKIPYLEQSLEVARAIKRIEIKENNIDLTIELGFPTKTIHQRLISELKQLLSALAPANGINIEVRSHIQAHVFQPNLQNLAGVKNIIAVASGKGGVGKSTTAINLALALSQAGARVGILDADIYGPNQPHMLGIMQKPELLENKQLKPVMAYDLQSMSIGYLVDVNTPMVWRGPMVSSALQQMTRDTCWENLDYLFIDLPPGTGDIQLTLAQKIPVSGSVIVTTPQEIALLDVRRAIEMFRKVHVPVLGIVENMSIHICSNCGHEEALFGIGGGEQMAIDCEVPLLGKIPLAVAIRQQADQGKPMVIAEPNSSLAQTYYDIALRMAAVLSLQKVSYAHKFPGVVVESNVPTKA